MNSEATAQRTVAPVPSLETRAKPKGKRAYLILGAIAAVTLLGIGGYALATHGQETTDDAQVDADLTPLSARVGGTVLKVHTKDNALVKAGDVLVELDPADFNARLLQAQAELATANAQLDAAKAQESIVASTAKGGFDTAKALLSGSSVGVSGADAQVAAADAALQRAKAEVHRAELDLARTRTLHEGGAAPQAQLESAQVTYETAEASLAQAKANLLAAQEARRGAKSRVAEAEGRVASSGTVDAQQQAAKAATELAMARVSAAEAAVTLAKNQVSYATIRAPTDGTVSKLGVHEGQQVTAGAPIAELVPNDTYVVANFKETQIGQMKVGDKATVKIDAYGRELEGRVESISAGTGGRFSLLPADNASGNFVKVVQRVPVKISWSSKPDLAMRAGLSADVTVKVGN